MNNGRPPATAICVLQRLALAFVLTAMLGCVSSSEHEGFAAVMDRSLSESRRLHAVQTLTFDAPDVGPVVLALNVLVWSDRHPINLRRAAMDRLLDHDTEAFWRAADRWLPRVDAPAMLAAIGERAVRADRRDVIPSLLERWAKPSRRVADTSRVEHHIFRQLTAPDDVIDSLWAYTARPVEPRVTPSRIPTPWSAWTVLSRLENNTRLRTGLRQAQTDSTLVQDLRAAAGVLDRLPANAEGLRWLAALREDQTLWAAYEAAARSWDRRAVAGISLRHLATWSRWPADTGDATAGELQSDVAAQLAAATRVARERPAGMAIEWPRGGVEGEGLERADLVVVQTILRAMAEPAVVAAWFAQADVDLADTTTEHGGVLTWARGGSFIARVYEPQRKEGDRKFFSPPELIATMYTGLAHYHFHAQAHGHAEYAGPGRGDLAFAAAMETHALTITFVDRDRLNLDLAFPDGRVLDLGCIERPTVDD